LNHNQGEKAMHTNLNHVRPWLKWAPSLFFAIAIFLFSSVPEKEVQQSYDRLAITLHTISATATAEPVMSTRQTISATPTVGPTQMLSPTLSPAQPVVTPIPKIPFPAVPEFLSFLQLDWLKVGHIVGYFWLGLTVLYALSARSRWSPSIALILCLLYGASDELHQKFVSGRMSLATDVLIDTLSALIGIAVLLGIRKLKAFLGHSQK
jgi:VanZ family protein